ncbi:hypothetical protein CEXT_179601 [Caerostris extrusa]|uniref:Uncharacterized protein n=1 Tax=Caerostris extrusa TaxID=172846 RepID=A0AAV4XD54_CAEEX|nr:hypothetical protein CEXT_179601 [Caerostris extrusa]
MAVISVAVIPKKPTFEVHEEESVTLTCHGSQLEKIYKDLSQKWFHGKRCTRNLKFHPHRKQCLRNKKCYFQYDRTLGMQNQGFQAKMDMDDERCPSKGEPTTPFNPQVFERQEFYDYSWDDSIRSHIYGGGLYWL